MTKLARTLPIGLLAHLLGWSSTAACGNDAPRPDEPARPTEIASPEADSPEPLPPDPSGNEPTIAYGAVPSERVFIRPEPNPDAAARGVLRWGATFEIVEQQGEGESRWYRMKDGGWVAAADVRTRESSPVELSWSPEPPQLEDALPYRYTRVTAEEGVPVYRRPPRRGEDPERVRTRDLQEGYFFTVDKWVNIYGRQLYRTTRYWFIPREGTTPVTGPTFQGVEITAGTQLPFLWVTDPTAKICAEPETTDACVPLERHRRLPLHERRGTWYRTEGGWITALQVAQVFRREVLPQGLRDGERWIHVDLRNQFAALYEGPRMVFATLISSGEDEHATPPGTYRIESKHVTATMDDEDNLNGPYYIQDVPWVLYFRGSYALHGAFWHDRFGLKSSHGCVNLSPPDARRFFHFATTPALPPGWHGVYAQEDERGTLVDITNS